MKANEYTKMIEKYIGNIENTEDIEEALALLNGTEVIKPFSERLLLFYNRHMKKDFTPTEAVKDIGKRAKQSSMDDDNTIRKIKDWFRTNVTPENIPKTRDALFYLAFLLGLNHNGTSELFNKVLFCRGFVIRRVEEFIYLHCLCRSKDYTTALHLIQLANASIKENLTVKAQTALNTVFLQEYARERDESEILDLIQTYPTQFNNTSQTAQKTYAALRDEICGTEDNPGLAQREHIHLRSGVANKTNTSFDFALETITGLKRCEREQKSKIGRFHRKEIIHNFPGKSAKDEKKLNMDGLRKGIILFFFYKYWVTRLLGDEKICDYDEFLVGLQDTLESCTFSPLYAGNPYDALFMICAVQVLNGGAYEPLDALRVFFVDDADNN
jgi:hypothetical protein